MTDPIFAGIDFGTARSCIGVWKDDSECQIINCEANRKFLPTIVNLSNLAVGSTDDLSVSTSVVAKLLGKEFSSMDDLMALPIPQGERVPSLVERKARFDDKSPEDLALLIFQKMKEIISTTQNSSAPIRVVITVPATAARDDAYRRIVKETADKIFDKVHILDDSIAGSYAYNLELKNENENRSYGLAIVDVGASNVKVSISTFSKNALTVRPFNVPVGQPNSATTAEVEAAIQQALNEVSVPIDYVALVGGSASRVPGIVKLVEDKFQSDGLKVFSRFDGDDAIAYGATCFAGNYFGDNDDLPDIRQPAGRRIGLQTFGGVMTPFIKEDTPTPMETPIVQEATTSKDDQTSLSLKVYEGFQKQARRNKPLGTFNLSGITRARRGVAKIDISFILDRNGILVVEAVDKTGSAGRKKLEVAKE